MQVTISKVTKYLITAPEIDPISAYMEDLGEHQGKVTIEQYGSAYACFWGSTGCKNITEFFMKCGNDYLANKMIPYKEQNEQDIDGYIASLKRFVLRCRRNKEVSKDTIRDWWDTHISSDLYSNLEDCDSEISLSIWIENVRNLHDVDIPFHDFFTSKSTSVFLHFRDTILPAVKQALSQQGGE